MNYSSPDIGLSPGMICPPAQETPHGQVLSCGQGSSSITSQGTLLCFPFLTPYSLALKLATGQN